MYSAIGSVPCDGFPILKLLGSLTWCLSPVLRALSLLAGLSFSTAYDCGSTQFHFNHFHPWQHKKDVNTCSSSVLK